MIKRSWLIVVMKMQINHPSHLYADAIANLGFLVDSANLFLLVDLADEVLLD
jgi:hypothetical protein